MEEVHLSLYETIILNFQLHYWLCEGFSRISSSEFVFSHSSTLSLQINKKIVEFKHYFKERKKRNTFV